MLTHKGTKDIKTKRLLLRKYRLSDVQQMFHNYASDPAVTRFLNWEPYQNVDEVKNFLTASIKEYDSPSIYNWAIEYNGEMIGSISTTYINDRDSACEVGYCIGQAYWNKGLMSEALEAVIGFLFHEVNMHRIMAKHDVDNPASGRVMQKCHMTFEGIFRKYYLHDDGTYSDSLIYGILKEEYDKK